MRQNEQRALFAVIAVLAFSTLALASAPRWAACVSSVLATLTVVPIVASRRILARPRPLLLLLAIPLIATSIQLIPLPAAIVRLVAPATYELAQANARAYSASVPSFLSLSQDWPGTLVELAKFLGYFAFAYTCVRLCASGRARRWLLVVVAVVGTIVALCALGHRVLGVKSMLGFYVPQVGEAYLQSLSPFLNPNHLAGYMAFVTPICLGLAAHRKSWFFLGTACICALTALQAISRGGVISLSVGVFVSLLLLSRSWRPRTEAAPKKLFWVALCLGLALVALAVFGAASGQELLHFDLQREQDAGKFLAWRSAPELLQSSPWVGVGRGAFEFSFTAFDPGIGVTYSHIENEYLQALLDWGVPVALAIFFAVAALVQGIIRRRPIDALSAGGIGGIAALLVQNLVDFNLELPGMAFPAIAVTATLVETRLVVLKETKMRSLYRTGRLAAIAACVFVCALAASSLGASPSEDIAKSEELDDAFTGSADDVVERALILSRRHPSSYLVHAEAAATLRRLGDPRAFKSLARALELHPNHSGVHFLAAHLLESSQKPRQAIAEYRAALALPTRVPKQILSSLMARFPNTEDLVMAVPDEPKKERTLGRIFYRMKRPDVAQRVAERAIRRKSYSYEIFVLGVEAAIANGETSAAVEIGEQADGLYRSEDSLLLYVSALQANKLPLVAIAALEESGRAENLDGLQVLCSLQLEVMDFSAAEISAGKLLTNSARSNSHRKAAHLFLSTIEDQKGNRHQATWHRNRAAELRDR